MGRPKTSAAPNGETTEYKYSGRSTEVIAKGSGSDAGIDRVISWSETTALGFPYRIRTYNKPTSQSSTNRSRGQLTRIYAESGKYNKDLYYNSVGLLAQETVTIDGAPQTFTMKYGYDSFLRPSTVTYPDNEVVTTSYNSMGLPAKLVSNAPATLVNGTTSLHSSFTDAVKYDEARPVGSRAAPDAIPRRG